jgi:hypothetical protein
VTIDVNAPEFKDAVQAAAKELLDKEAGGLKAKNEELLGEVKALRTKFDGVDPDEYKKLKTTKREADDKNADPVELRKRIEDEFTPKLDEATKRASEAEGKLNQHIIDSALTSALLEAGVAKEFLPAAKALLRESRKVEVNDGGAVVDGKPVQTFTHEWAKADGKAFVSAPDNSGGGARGGNGGGAASGKKLSELSVAEKAALMREIGGDAYKQKVNSETKAN